MTSNSSSAVVTDGDSGVLEKAASVADIAGNVMEFLAGDTAQKVAAAMHEDLGNVVGLVCPPVAPVLRTLHSVLDMANAAKDAEQAFGQLAAHLTQVEAHLKWADKAEETLRRRCAEQVAQVSVSLQDAKQLLERYQSKGWIQKWFSARRFSEDLLGISSRLSLSVSVLSLERASQVERQVAMALSPGSRQKATSRAEELERDVRKMAEGIAERQQIPRDREGIRERLRQVQLSRAESDDSVVGKARVGDFAAVGELIRQGKGTANDAGSTFALIHQAVFWEDAFAVAMLINLRADVNERTGQASPDLDIPKGSTALHIAVAIANDKIVRLLICSEARTDVKDGNGKKPEELDTTDSCRRALAQFKRLVDVREEMATKARKRKLADAVALGLENNVPFDTRLGRDFSIVHYAAMHGDLGTYRIAVAAGASPSLRSAKDDLFPSAVAKKFKHDDLSAQLRAREAHPAAS